MEQREMFVTSEPKLGEDFCVVVSVKHHEKGLIRRMFVSEHKMKEVYDWVGSLSMYPMYFDLCDYQKDSLSICWHNRQLSVHFKYVWKRCAKWTGNIRWQCRSVRQCIRCWWRWNGTFFSDFQIPKPAKENIEKECNCNFASLVQKYINEFQKKVGETVNVLCHRHSNRFWKVLLRQGVDFSKIDTKIIWAGEPGADGGGLYREFLLYAITNLENSNLLFGKSPNCLFTGYADAILKNTYRVLGQISALGILFINHGPECLHNALVNKLFGISDTFELEDLHSFDG